MWGFSIGPNIREKDGRIIATTSVLVWLFTFGLYRRRVVIDPQRQTVTIHSRWLWFISRQRTIRFRDIAAITYGYEDLSLNGPLTLAHDTYDSFTVGLRLVDESEFKLFTFHGDGTFKNESCWPDWMYWCDFQFDLSGNQQRESRLFVNLLGRLINVTVVPPRS